MFTDLHQLAGLIQQRNKIEVEITRLIGRPALIEHVGEFIAACIFNIQLVESASNKTIDGHFLSAPLTGKSVNIKWYGKQENILDITPASLPDYYLVLTGPKSDLGSSRGVSRPWLIDYVFLFDAIELVDRIKARVSKIGFATSVPKLMWDQAEIFPQSASEIYVINDEQVKLLRLFSSQ